MAPVTFEGNEIPISTSSPGLVGNRGDPIKLTNVKLCGVAAETARPSEIAKVWTRMAITSDDPIFHRIVENLGPALAEYVRDEGKHFDPDRAESILLVIHSDETADLWIDSAAVFIRVLAKRDIRRGELIFENDIADITELRFPFVDIRSTDGLLYLFRQDWRFALFFDFNPDRNLCIDEVARFLGTLYRRLKYRHLYDVLSDEVIFGRLVEAGWFPFVEIIGAEFRKIARTCEAGLNLDEAEAQLLRAFDNDRVDRILARWIAKPHFRMKEPILRSAVNAYKAQDPIAALKIVLTEIEGVLAEAYRSSTGKSAKIKELLKFAANSAERKAGMPDTLLFPAAFTRYLETYTFSSFDPISPTTSAGSRHAVGHGAAKSDTYTQTRALQALLTLDQLAFYT